MSNPNPHSLLKSVAWSVAGLLFVGLVVFNIRMGNQLASRLADFRKLDQLVKHQNEQIAEYEALKPKVEKLRKSRNSEREQFFSMLQYSRSCEDFSVRSGGQIVSCRGAITRDRPTSVFFYVPTGDHQLVCSDWHAQILEKRFDALIFEKIDLEGETVYEIRFSKIDRKNPGPAGFELIGEDAQGKDIVLAKHEFPFPEPVFSHGVESPYNVKGVIRFPQQQISELIRGQPYLVTGHFRLKPIQLKNVEFRTGSILVGETNEKGEPKIANRQHRFIAFSIASSKSGTYPAFHLATSDVLAALHSYGHGETIHDVLNDVFEPYDGSDSFHFRSSFLDQFRENGGRGLGE